MNKNIIENILIYNLKDIYNIYESKIHELQSKLDISESKIHELQSKLNISESKIHELQSKIDIFESKLDIETDKNKQNELYNKIIVSPTQVITDYDFWNVIVTNKLNINNSIKEIEYLLSEFGTSLPCNIFDIGNCIEHIICKYLESLGFIVNELPNENRIDLNIYKYKKLSIKYSSCGDITLHNSNSSINKDENMCDLLLLTPTNLYLITNKEINRYKIKLKEFLVNKGDSLKLKRSILTELNNKKYPFVIELNIKIDKKKCKNRLCYKLFYEKFKHEFMLK